MKLVPLLEYRKRYLLALGQIVYGFGHIEDRLHSLLAMMLGDFRLADNLTYSQQFEFVKDVLRATFYSKDQTEDAKAIFDYILDELARLTRGRNENFHCQWHFDDEKQQGHRIKFLKHKHGVIHILSVDTYVPPQDLERLGREIFAFQDELRIFETWYFINPKLPDTPGAEPLIPKRFYDRLLAKSIEHKNKKKK